jgi:hypothetical protein
MTNTEHNEKILAEIMQLQERLERLKSQIKPADEMPTVALTESNAGALAARMAEFDQQAAIKRAVERALNPVEAKPKKASQNAEAKETETKAKNRAYDADGLNQ